MEKLLNITVIIFVLVLGYTFTSCEKEITDGISECIANKISDFVQTIWGK